MFLFLEWKILFLRSLQLLCSTLGHTTLKEGEIGLEDGKWKVQNYFPRGKSIITARSLGMYETNKHIIVV